VGSALRSEDTLKRKCETEHQNVCVCGCMYGQNPPIEHTWAAQRSEEKKQIEGGRKDEKSSRSYVTLNGQHDTFYKKSPICLARQHGAP
jgi:hypothetical protein